MSEGPHFRKARSVNDRELEEKVKELSVGLNTQFCWVPIIIYRAWMSFSKKPSLLEDT